MSRLISIKLDQAGATEPVALQDVKDYMKIDFIDDDDLITALIMSARTQIERYLGFVLVDTSVTAVYRQNCGGNGLELFYGPILDESGVPAITGLPDDAEVIGEGVSVWVKTCVEEVKLTYDSGWDAVPNWAKLSIKMLVAFWYEHRGDEDKIGKIAPEVAVCLYPHKVTMHEVLL